MTTATPTAAATLRARADRAAAVLIANRALLARHGVNVDAHIIDIRGAISAANARHAAPYDGSANAPLFDAARTLARIGNRLNGTRTNGYGRHAVIETTGTSAAAAADGDNLVRIGLRISLDILADRADDPLFDVR